MGWASGSQIAEDIWNLVKKYIDPERNKYVAMRIIEIFENEDCDTIQEAEELCKAAGYKPYNEDDESE